MGRWAEGPCPAWGSPGKKSSWQAALLAAFILSSCFLLTQAKTISVTLNPLHPLEGQDVTLTPGGTSNFLLCRWFREGDAEKNRIFTYYPVPNPVQQDGPSSTGRETAGSNCSLSIRSLALKDTGNYTVLKDSPDGPESGSVRIEVLELLSKPSVSAFPSRYLTEFIDSVNLTCEITSKTASVSWLYNGEPLEINPRINVSMDNRTLAINGAVRSDAGGYQCNVSNPASTNQSDPMYISVIYGPDTPEIRPNETFYNEHSEVSLSCYADAFPDAHYIWSINEKERSTESKLHIPDVLSEDSGKYVCQAWNVLSRQKNSTSLNIEVAGSVYNVTINGPSTAIEYHPVHLKCSSFGSDVSYHWLKGNQLVEAGGRIILTDNNRSLTFTSSNRDDTANYTCQGVNSFSSNSSQPHWLNIFYGPDTPIIDPQESVYNEGSTLNLSCFAISNPPANYSWWYNDQLLEDQHESQLLIPDLSGSNAGIYTCNATNDNTGYFNASSLEISILSSVYNVTINGPSTAIEYHPVHLKCSSFGSDVSYHWLKGNQLVEAGGRIILTDNNRSLTFTSSNRDDTANYTCQGVNSFSSNSSQPHWLNIFYGPDTPIIDPQESVYNEGSTLNLSCFAISNPPANYSWWYNDQLLEDQHESQLLIPDLSGSNAGIYTCNATNDNTGYFNASSLEISILKRVSNVTIVSHPEKAIENQPTVLNCSSAGSNVSYIWLKGNQKLTSGDRISLNNSSLIFNPTSRNDSGNYSCYGYNSFSNSRATYWLDVFYGPDDPVISPQGHDYAEGSPLTLHCYADSNPASQYTWYFNENELRNAEFPISSLAFNHSGNYTCNASNTETNLSSSASWEIKVFAIVSNVSIEGPSETIEYDSVTLSCISNGSEVSYTWFKENQRLEDGDHISLLGSNHESLVLSPVNRSDAGSYTCHGINSVSEDTSDAFPLDVLYGPDDPIISPQEHSYVEGSTISLVCDAPSNPVAQYTWFFNETEEMENSSQLVISDASFDNSGNYTCNATNVKTDNSSAVTWEIQVLEKLSQPILWPAASTVKEHENVTLNCTTSESSSVSVSWLKDGNPIPVKSILSARNRTLTVPDISKDDEGMYTCEARNLANSATSNPSKITLENAGSQDNGLSAGQIVGIVIGCLLGAVIIVAVVYFVLKKTSFGMTAQHSSNGNIPSAPGRNQGVTDTKPTAGEEDIQYTTLAFNSNNPSPPGPGPTSPSESGTIYSVIKKK
ncbi:carcinoembryonic antigen-related cell adhesion molecule 5-like [Eublepharis macularius]|uniref:Carcinoembryonic antigen-related cell adhesion molecule 5-like n=1 Tax=Eublepharis macularius TaxID=481883 RepID=A0AA97KB63_EUBMA|nr:carcinoembryonic antigen-related cell adhesion molecule 5-like [Eublepharis macularius]